MFISIRLGAAEVASNILVSAEKKTDARGDRTVNKHPHKLPELVKKNRNGTQSSGTGRGSVGIY